MFFTNFLEYISFKNQTIIKICSIKEIRAIIISFYSTATILKSRKETIPLFLSSISSTYVRFEMAQKQQPL